MTGLTNYGISIQWYTSQQWKGTDIHNCMDDIQNNYVEWKMPEEKNIYCMIPFIENSRKC